MRTTGGTRTSGALMLAAAKAAVPVSGRQRLPSSSTRYAAICLESDMSRSSASCSSDSRQPVTGSQPAGSRGSAITGGRGTRNGGITVRAAVTRGGFQPLVKAARSLGGSMTGSGSGGSASPYAMASVSSRHRAGSTTVTRAARSVSTPLGVAGHSCSASLTPGSSRTAARWRRSDATEPCRCAGLSLAKSICASGRETST